MGYWHRNSVGAIRKWLVHPATGCRLASWTRNFLCRFSVEKLTSFEFIYVYLFGRITLNISLGIQLTLFAFAQEKRCTREAERRKCALGNWCLLLLLFTMLFARLISAQCHGISCIPLKWIDMTLVTRHFHLSFGTKNLGLLYIWQHSATEWQGCLRGNDGNCSAKSISLTSCRCELHFTSNFRQLFGWRKRQVHSPHQQNRNVC